MIKQSYFSDFGKNTTTRLKNSRSRNHALPSHEAWLSVMERSEMSFNTKLCCHQVEKLSINAPALLSCKAGGTAVEGSGSPSTLDNVDNLALAPNFPHCLEQTCETPNRLKDFTIKWQGLPSHTAECKTAQRLGSPSTSDDVENLARAPDSQHCLEWTSEVKYNYYY